MSSRVVMLLSLYLSSILYSKESPVQEEDDKEADAGDRGVFPDHGL